MQSNQWHTRKSPSRNHKCNHRQFLLPLAKCARNFYELCTKVLYHSVTFSGARACKIFRTTIAANPTLASYVHDVYFNSFEYGNYFWPPSTAAEVQPTFPISQDFLETDGSPFDLAQQAIRDHPFWHAVALLICLTPNIAKLTLPSLGGENVRTTQFCNFINSVVNMRNGRGIQKAPLSKLQSLDISTWLCLPYGPPSTDLKYLSPFLKLKSLRALSVTLSGGNIDPQAESVLRQADISIRRLKLAVSAIDGPTLSGFLCRFKCLEYFELSTMSWEYCLPPFYPSTQIPNQRAIIEGLPQCLKRNLKVLEVLRPQRERCYQILQVIDLPGSTNILDGLQAIKLLHIEPTLLIAWRNLSDWSGLEPDDDAEVWSELADKVRRSLEVLNLQMSFWCQEWNELGWGYVAMLRQVLKNVYYLVSLDDPPPKLGTIQVRRVNFCKCSVGGICRFDCGILEQLPIIRKILERSQKINIIFECCYDENY